MASVWMGVAVVGSVSDGDEEGDEVVADDQKNEQKQAVPDEHVEKRETEAQELQTFGVLAEWDLLLVDLLMAAVASFLGFLIEEAYLRSLAVSLSLLPVWQVLGLIKHHLIYDKFE